MSTSHHSSDCVLKCKEHCLCDHYQNVVKLMTDLTSRFSQPIVMYMEDTFEYEVQNDVDKKERYFQSHKQFNKSLNEATLISSEMYDQQLKMVVLNTNMRFLLRNAHNNVSYHALARYFAEYAFYAQKINRMGKNSSHNYIVDFVKNTEFLKHNYFDMLFETVELMKQRLEQNIFDHPEKYTNYDDKDVYVCVDKDSIKDSYKSHLAEMKKKDEEVKGVK